MRVEHVAEAEAEEVHVYVLARLAHAMADVDLVLEAFVWAYIAKSGPSPRAVPEK